MIYITVLKILSLEKSVFKSYCTKALDKIIFVKKIKYWIISVKSVKLTLLIYWRKGNENSFFAIVYFGS